MNSFIASCAPNPASGARFSGFGAFALAIVCVVAEGGGGDGVDRKRVCLAIAREALNKELLLVVSIEAAPRLALIPAVAWEERRGEDSRLKKSRELVEENITRRE
jgi:hypothetical protein